VSPPRLLLPCIFLRLRRGRNEGWRRGCAGGRRTRRARGLWHGRERTLSPSVTRASRVPFSFLFYAGY
jgi:hypothetical protein